MSWSFTKKLSLLFGRLLHKKYSSMVLCMTVHSSSCKLCNPVVQNLCAYCIHGENIKANTTSHVEGVDLLYNTTLIITTDPKMHSIWVCLCVDRVSDFKVHDFCIFMMSGKRQVPTVAFASHPSCIIVFLDVLSMYCRLMVDCYKHTVL